MVQKKSSKKLRIISYNVQYGEGLTGRLVEYLKFWKLLFPNNKTDLKLIDFVKKFNPDIIGLIEVNEKGLSRKYMNEAELFRKKLNFKSNAQFVKYEFDSIYKLAKFIPVLKTKSNAIITKHVAHNISRYYFSKGFKKTVIHSLITFDNQKINVFLVHLSLSKKTRKHQLKELAEIVNSVKGNKLVMGDFNSFKDDLAIADFLSAANLKMPVSKNKVPKTFPSFKPKFAVDHIFVSKKFKVLKYEAIESKLSDHLPLLLDLSLN